jgi:hypothetical protein
MTTLILTLRSPDNARAFEVLVHFEERLVLSETAIEIYPDGRREWRDSRDVALLVGRKPEGGS